jgi:hypothetical protein
MQANNNQKLSLKDKITSKLPGHRNQDNNMNGVPDRLERGTGLTPFGGAATTTNTSTTSTYGSDLNRNGIPDQLERQGSYGTGMGYSQDLNRNGIPDQLERQGSWGTSAYGAQPAMGLQQGMGFSEDLNRNGIPDQLERQGSWSNTSTGFTDLNRNGIPDQLEGAQSFGFVGSVSAIQSSVVDVRQAPVIVEKIEKPAVVHEVYKTEEVVQIQPIIERERDQLDVYEVIQPMREREVIATEVRQLNLPAQTRATVVQDNSAFLAARSAPVDFSTREVAATRSAVVENAPIIHETIVHKVIEEVQPVIYKEVDRPILIKETLPIYEKIVEAPHIHKNVMPMRDLGVRSVTTTTTTGFTDLNRDGIPDQLQGGLYQSTGLQSGLQSTMLPSQGLSSGFASSGFSQDLNRNGIPDQLERQGSYGTGMGYSQDLNRNGIPDSMERSSFGQQPAMGMGYSQDLNRNGIPDQFERQSAYPATSGLAGGLNDRNGNGIPDNLEARRSFGDLNGNGIPDRMEKPLSGFTGTNDSLERRMMDATLNPNRSY